MTSPQIRVEPPSSTPGNVEQESKQTPHVEASDDTHYTQCAKANPQHHTPRIDTNTHQSVADGDLQSVYNGGLESSQESSQPAAISRKSVAIKYKEKDRPPAQEAQPVDLRTHAGRMLRLLSSLPLVVTRKRRKWIQLQRST
jgi:hypothetical protein